MSASGTPYRPAAGRGASYEQPPPPGAPYAGGAAVAATEPQRTSGAVFALVVCRILVWLVYAFALVATVLLLIAFFLQLTGANPAAPFASWVYRSTNVLLEPFRSLYPTQKITGQSQLNLSIVFAIFMYGLFAVVFDAAVGWFDRWIRRTRLAEAQYAAPPPPPR
jgi:uncharacterized protein YggT (Ycf19 family)